MTASEHPPRALASLLLLLFTALAACAPDSENIAYSSGSRSSFATQDGSTQGGSTPKDRYLRIQGEKKNKPGRLALVLPCDLWAPLRVEVAGGLFDANRADEADGSTFGLELDGRGPFPPTTFYGIASLVTNGGMNVFAYTHNSSTPIGSQFFPNTTEVDLAVAFDAQTFSFEARPRGAPGFTPVATFAKAGQSEPLIPSIGVFNLLNKGVIGYDEFRIVLNGTAPNPLPAGQDAARMIWEAVSPMLEALYAADCVPDFAAASTQLADAATKLDAARDAVKALPEGRDQKKAKKDLKKAAKKLASAANLAQKEKKEGRIISLLKKAMKKAGKAAYRVYDIE